MHARLYNRFRAGISAHRDLFHELDLSVNSFGMSGRSTVELCVSCNSGCVADSSLDFVDVLDALDLVHEISGHHPGRKQRDPGRNFRYASALDV